MRRALTAFIAFLLTGSLSLQAAGQPVDPDILRSLAGSWLVAPINGAPGCRVRLGAEPAIGGHALELEPDCAAKVPAIASAAAWHPVGGLTLISATRQPLLRFTENEDASYSAPEPAPGYVLVRAPAGVDRVANAGDAFGDWVMRRPDGEVICRVHLSNRPPPGGQESYAVRVTAQGCQTAVTRLRLASWRVEAPKLVLYGLDGNSLSFLRTATGFMKDPAEGGRPLLLERAGR
ncbi:AprI/Inh family metalloprotease inhibitor [Phreatobacter sp.]|uniref:AprI/Inh family metalloprotease inhibitor n=1 Tax=Phreatobacter sp. TaxID=1966341 RepID=UPI003F6F7765